MTRFADVKSRIVSKSEVFNTESKELNIHNFSDDGNDQKILGQKNSARNRKKLSCLMVMVNTLLMELHLHPPPPPPHG